jgi:hypothetical protein
LTEVCATRRRDLRLVGPLGATVSFHAAAAGNVQFRIEATNAFNMVNLSNPTTCYVTL